LFGDYVGLGAGAHGKVSLAKPEQILRTTKPKQPRDYQEQIRAAPSDARIQIGESACIASADLPFEFMLNALRLNDGFSRDCYERATGLPMESVQSKLEAARERGLLRAFPGGWQPTELGRRFLNDLQVGFLA
jgi:oxygen-independent coproporphyrinogen-3 oxidase